MTAKLLILSILLLPLYTIRFRYGLVRTNIFEIVVGLATLSYLWQARLHIISQIYNFFFKKHPVFLILGIVGLLGMWSTQEFTASLGVLKAYFIVPLIFVFLIERVFFTRNRGEVPIWALLFSAAGVSLVSAIQVVLSLPEQIIRPTAFYTIGTDPNVTQGGFANYVAMYLTPIFFLAGVLLPSAYRTKHFKRWLTLVLLTLGGILITQSFTAYITVVALSVLVTFWVGMHEIKWHRITLQRVPLYFLSLIAVVVASVPFVFFITQLPKFQNLFDPFTRNSLSARLQIWHAAWEIIKDNPITGIGLADFQRVYKEVIPNLYFPPLEWLVPEPHNVFLAFWVHTGIIGLGVFFWILIRHFRDLSIILKKISQPQAVIFFVAFLSFYVQGLLDTTFWKNDLAVLFMLVLLYVEEHVSLKRKPIDEVIDLIYKKQYRFISIQNKLRSISRSNILRK